MLASIAGGIGAGGVGGEDGSSTREKLFTVSKGTGGTPVAPFDDKSKQHCVKPSVVSPFGAISTIPPDPRTPIVAKGVITFTLS